MLSAKKTMFRKIGLVAIIITLGGTLVQAQNENSPYSRYGIGDLVPSQNILTRGMGGTSSAYFDFQSINFVNPASYSRLKVTTLDFGVEIDSKTLRTIDPPSKFNGISPNISYLQLGFPLSKSHNWGMNIGLRPVSRVYYKSAIESTVESDTMRTLFEGNGGGYQVYGGTGFSIGKVSLGANLGYMFGSKNYSSIQNFQGDTLNTFFYPARYSTKTNYSGVFVNAGLQYRARLSRLYTFQFGAHGNLQNKIDATRDQIVETIVQQTNGPVRIDSVKETLNQNGDMVYPASYGVGIALNRNDKWIISADYGASKWSQYRLFGETDMVQDSWRFNMGGQIIPNGLNPKSYWGRVAYRAGFMIGQDYIKVDGDLPIRTFSFGMGLPMRKANYTNQFTVIQTAFEFGQRGNNSNLIKENFFRFSLGLTLSDVWFQKRKYE
jgi:hypothetical protein